jgi:S-adenosylmethionine:tRNA ribosyltransferase-isomerase
LKLADFDYALPPERIAQEPLPERDASRLLVLDRATGRRRHAGIRELPDLLSPGDLLVVNRSRVIPARLLGQKTGTGGQAEVLLVRRLPDGCWEALVWPGRRLRPGHEIRVAPDLRVRIESESRGEKGLRLVRLLGDADDEALVARHGHMPLPPYIARPDRPEDRERYQTVYARETGSVAAPTAGLHFTPELLDRLDARGVRRAEIVLHVGPGTFLPVKVDDVEQHHVPAEPCEVPAATADAIRRARACGGRVVAVGTTTVRTLESAALEGGLVSPGSGETDLVVVPGFRFRVVDALVTNFHLPRSSLLLLVAAFAGREAVLAAYAEAIEERYRFYSYGDAMLIL